MWINKINKFRSSRMYIVKTLFVKVIEIIERKNMLKDNIVLNHDYEIVGNGWKNNVFTLKIVQGISLVLNAINL